MKREQYFDGMLAVSRDCINYGNLDGGMNYDGAFLSSPLPDDLTDSSRSRQLGERFAYRAFRDYENADAIDLVAARLWKWGAEEELDRFLAFIGMDDDDADDELTLDEFIVTVRRRLSAEPVPVADRPALADKVANLRLLDRNGAATITDGSLDHLSDAEVAEIIDRAIADIHREHEATLPPIVAYEKLSGEIVLDYAEGGAR